MKSLEYKGELLKTEYGWAVKSLINGRETILPLHEADEYLFKIYPNDFWEGRSGMFAINEVNRDRRTIDTMRLVDWDESNPHNPIKELEKCVKSPYYFATSYMKVNGLPFITDLTESDFNRHFNAFFSPSSVENVTPEFEDCEVSEFHDKELYSGIENLVIEWSNDGHKTAGTLARRILKLINERKV
jgi:hypothetical protein